VVRKAGVETIEYAARVIDAVAKRIEGRSTPK
jgi:hypothetical protein